MPENTSDKPSESPTSVDRIKREIEIANRAMVGIIAVRCPPTEVFRVVENIYILSKENHTRFRMHSQLTGWGTFEDEAVNLPGMILDEEAIAAFDPIMPVTQAKNTAAYLAAFEAMPDHRDDDPTRGRNSEAMPDNCFYVMVDAHHYLEEPGMKTCLRRQAQRAYSCEQRLFLVMPETVDIPDDIAPFLHIIDYEYPLVEELETTFSEIIAGLEDDSQPDFSAKEIHTLAQNALGMTKTAFENAVGLAITDWSQDHPPEEYGPATFDHFMKWLRKYKVDLLRKTDVLELQDPVAADQIGGLENLREWMDVRKHTFEPAAVERGITPSRGVLVAGSPGSGKSLFGKVAGSMLGLPVVRFDVGRVFGSYIGQSEGRMRGALKLLDAMSPLVAVIDEVDKSLGGIGNSNDSGTSSRVFGTFLTWMQERDQKKRPIFVIFTANRVQALPPELLRKGRVDELWAVNSPNETERREILKIHAEKRKLKIRPDDMDTLLELTKNLVGAEIEALVEQCLIHAYMENSEYLSLPHFRRERSVITPISVSFKADFDAIEDWGRQFARAASKPVNDPPKGPSGSNVKRLKAPLRKPRLQ